FNEIRSAVAVDCVYKVPDPPAGQSFDGRVNVVYTDSAKKEHPIGYNDAMPCNEGWQFTDATKTEIKLCGTSCDDVKADANPTIVVQYGCKTVPVGEVR